MVGVGVKMKHALPGPDVIKRAESRAGKFTISQSLILLCGWVPSDIQGLGFRV